MAKKTASEDTKCHMFHYVLSSFERVRQEESSLKKRANLKPMSDALQASRSSILHFTSLILTGTFNNDGGSAADAGALGSLAKSPLLEPLLEESLPMNFLVDLAALVTRQCKEYGGFDHFKEVS